MKKKYYYVYLIVNLLNGMYYIGAHSTNNLYDNYMGSGIRLKKAQDEMGVGCFIKEILRYCDTEEEMYAYEAEIVNQEVVDDPMSYNDVVGGHGGYKVPDEKRSMWIRRLSESHQGQQSPNKGKQFSFEWRQKLSDAKKGKSLSEEHRKHISESLQDRVFTAEHRQKLSDASTGKKKSEETRKKMSEWRKGRHWRLDPETNKRIYY